MKKILILLSLFYLLVGTSTITRASHIPSSNLTWTCDPNNPLCYTFIFTQVINCPSTNPTTMPTNQFTFTNNCGLTNPTMGTMTQIGTSYDVAQTCATATSTCAGGTVPGAWLATYEATVCFPADCDSWIIDYELCCRDASTNTSGASSQDMHVQSILNTSTAPCNNGPVVTSSAIPYMCAGQNNTYCLTTADPDADSTYYQMTPPLGDNGNPINFAAGYSYTNPLQNFSLNNNTGCMTFNQATTGNFVVAVLIESYDNNGNLISSIIHDYQIEVINCSNVPPNPPAGGSFTNLVGGGTQTGPSTLDLCYGDNFCFDVVFSDPDGANNLTLSSNGPSLLPGATFVQTGTNPATGTLCWTAQPGALSNVITFDVEDDACPIVGTNSFSVTFNIATGLYAGPDAFICNSQSAQLTASGSGSYTWSPATGLSCTNCQNPVASPTTTTTYTVTGNLVGSCPNTDQVTVTVYSPTAGFTADTACFGTPTTFTDTSSTISGAITNWDWDFDNNGTIDNSTQNPTFTNPSNNSYTATLIITTDSGCTDTASMNVYISDLPVADFTPDTVCAGNISSFFDMSASSFGIQSWSWDFDNDGNEDANTQNPTYTFPSFGTYPVSLSVIDNNGCTHDTIKNVYVSAQPTADFTVTNECFGSANNFTDLSNPNGGVIASWDWDFTNDGTVDDTNQNPSNGYPSSGNYTVELLVTTQLGCVDSITKPVSVHPIPVADFTVDTACYGTLTTFTDNSNVGTGAITNWDWDFGDAVGTSVAQNPTYTYGTNNTFSTTLIVTTDSGCVDTTEIDVYIHDLPVADFTPDTACAGNVSQFMDVTATASGIQNWSWDFDNDGNEDANTQNPTYTFPGFGTYPVSLSVIDNNGCTHDTIKNVYVSAQPTADFTVTNECFGSANNFTDLSNPNGGVIASWDWDFTNDGTVDDTNQNPSNGYPSSGNYTVELLVTTQLGCVDSITKPVSVHPIPVADFTVDTACYGTLTTFTDNSNVGTGAITNWDWDFGDAVGTSVAQNPTYTYGTNNTFTTTLIVTTDSGCVDTTEIDVYIHDLPVADFTPDTACAGNVSQFMDVTATASGIQNWSWDFDNDGNEDANTQNPTYTFPGFGTYPVSLSVIDNNGCTHDTIKNVYVSAQPTADFTVTNECFGSANNFTDLSNPNGGVIASWDWDFTNDGTVDDTNQNPSNGYPSSGNYTVELLVTTQLGCVDSITKPVSVHPMPVANFSVADVCLNDVSNLYDSSTVATGNIISWAWDFDNDGNIDDTNQNPTNTYATDGTFAVTLTVTTDSGCINIYTDSATVDPLPTAAFTVNNICIDTAAIYTDNSNGNGGTIANWDWDFDGDGTTDNTNQNPTNTYASHGQYNVQLIVSTAAGCADTITQPIDIYPMPVADFTFQNQCYATPVPFTDNSMVATGAITGWQWYFGNTNTSIAQNPSENYGSEGVYEVQLVVTTDNGCRDTVTHNNIEVYPTPVVDFTPTDVCLNAPTVFQDLSNVSNMYTTNNITNWDWDFGDGVGTSNLQNPTYTYTQEGTYAAELIVVSNHGCTDSLTKNVTVHPLPTVDFEGPAQGCSPVCVQLINNSAITSGTIDTWVWNFGDGNTSGSQAPNHCWYNDSQTSAENYDVTLTAISNFGCVDSMTIPAMVTSYPIPQAIFTYNPLETDIYDPEINFIDQSIIASQWQWDLGDGTTSTIQNPVHTYADSGTYVVTLYMENTYGCRDTATKNVVIKPTFAIWIPNVFTPDGDGVNDYWFSDGYGITELQTLVFDRWGLVVYEGYQLDSKWDGTYKGKMSIQDTYVYKIKARDVFGEWHEYIGKVTLLK